MCICNKIRIFAKRILTISPCINKRQGFCKPMFSMNIIGADWFWQQEQWICKHVEQCSAIS